MRQVLVQIPVGISLLQSHSLLPSEFPSVLTPRSPHRYSENRKREAAFDVSARVIHAADGSISDRSSFCEKVDGCRRYDSFCSELKIRNAG